MLTYEKNFAPRPEDGRYVCTLAAIMAQMRDMKPELAYPEPTDREAFRVWRGAVQDRIMQLLQLPQPTPQPAPKMLSTVQREGYRVEKWEFYPDDYCAVPFLALIPDGADAQHPVPAVMCFLGSNHNKEFVAGEPQLEHPNCQVAKYPERNRMGKYLAENGMAAFVFDNPGIGECSVMGDPEAGDTQMYSRVQMCSGMLRIGMSYPGLSVFQKQRFMEHLYTLPYVDQDRIGISSHSLGTETAILLALLRDDIKAIVFNDGLTGELRRYAAVTEEGEREMYQDRGNWHTIPGALRYFGLTDLCAAFAPNYLGLTEGGGDEWIDTVRRAYRLFDAEDRLLVSYYPVYQDPATRTKPYVMPDHGLTNQEYFDYNYIDAPDHSFRREPALELLRRCFFAEEQKGSQKI